MAEAFLSLGLSKQKAEETAKNVALSKRLLTIIEEAKQYGSVSQNGTLYYHLASKMKPQLEIHIPFLVGYIDSKKLDTTLRVEEALLFLLSNIEENIVNVKAFEDHCGLGIKVSPEEITEKVACTIEKHKAEILELRYRFNTGSILQELKKCLKWADGKSLKMEFDVQLAALLGPKTEEDSKPLTKVKKKVDDNVTDTKERKETTGTNIPESDTSSIIDMMKKLNFHKPGENYKTDGYVVNKNTAQLLKLHLERTGGIVRTRFPPEPNGILHIGHAKAININFGYAAAHGGVCILRYDDTNPEKEEEKFFVGIGDMVRWLGYTPYKITHSSDYFDQLYEWAEQLIKLGLAYVCHQKAEEIKGFNPPPSPWRDRPILESLTLFQNMKMGLIDEGEATLRMKVTLEEGKQDPVAYRIKFLPHPRTDKWCIYPTYDYTHCLCDSIEDITHSLCTKEFQSRRSAYYWLCNSLNVYCPVQWEYGRLNVNYTVVSKRKIAKLITEGIVKDWDDPRLFTLSALRRRGFPSEAINRFCAKIGVTGAQATVDPQMLESEVRTILNGMAPRTMIVTEPLRVKIINFDKINAPSSFEVPDFPGSNGRGTHTIHFSDTIYIETTDFKHEFEDGYRRLAPGQSVGLRYTSLIIHLVNKQYKRGKLHELHVEAQYVDNSNKPKAFIHWVSNPFPVLINMYNRLFLHENPEDTEQVKGGFLSDINPNSFKELRGFADRYLRDVGPSQTFQLERIGYFCLDANTSVILKIFNRTVSLKEDPGK